MMNLAFLVITCCLVIYFFCSLVNCSLGSLVLLVIVRLTLPTQSTLNVNLEFVSITIMSKGGNSKHNTVLELTNVFVNLRNVCNPWPFDVSSTRKCALFACELEAPSSRC